MKNYYKLLVISILCVIPSFQVMALNENKVYVSEISKTLGEVESVIKMDQPNCDQPVAPKEEDCSLNGSGTTPQDKLAITMTFDELTTLKEKYPDFANSPEFQAEADKIITGLDQKLSASGKAQFMKEFLEKNADALNESARKALVDHPLYKEFREAQMRWDQKVTELKIWNAGYKNGYGTFDVLFGNVQNNLTEIQNSLKKITDELVAITDRLGKHPASTPEIKEKVNTFLYDVHKTNLSAYGDSSSVHNNAQKIIDGQIEATKTSAALAASMVVTAGASGVIAGAGAGRMVILAGQAVRGGGLAYSFTLSLDTSKELIKSVVSGKDVSCEFAHRLAEKGPEMRATALKSGMMGALLGGGIGALVLKGGATAATTMAVVKLGAIGFGVKGVAGATESGIKSSEALGEATELLRIAIETNDPLLEAEARKKLALAADGAIDAGFEGLNGIAQAWGGYKNAKSLYDDLAKNQTKIVSILSGKPGPASVPARNSREELNNYLAKPENKITEELKLKNANATDDKSFASSLDHSPGGITVSSTISSRRAAADKFLVDNKVTDEVLNNNARAAQNRDLTQVKADLQAYRKSVGKEELSPEDLEKQAKAVNKAHTEAEMNINKRVEDDSSHTPMEYKDGRKKMNIMTAAGLDPDEARLMIKLGHAGNPDVKINSINLEDMIDRSYVTSTNGSIKIENKKNTTDISSIELTGTPDKHQITVRMRDGSSEVIEGAEIKKASQSSAEGISSILKDEGRYNPARALQLAIQDTLTARARPATVAVAPQATTPTHVPVPTPVTKIPEPVAVIPRQVEPVIPQRTPAAPVSNTGAPYSIVSKTAPPPVDVELGSNLSRNALNVSRAYTSRYGSKDRAILGNINSSQYKLNDNFGPKDSSGATTGIIHKKVFKALDATYPDIPSAHKEMLQLEAISSKLGLDAARKSHLDAMVQRAKEISAKGRASKDEFSELYSINKGIGLLLRDATKGFE